MEVPLRLEDGPSQHVGAWRRNVSQNERHRALVQRALRLTRAIPFYPAIFGVGRECRHARCLERPRVRPGAVAIAIQQDRGPVRHQLVQELARWRAALEGGQRPSPTDDPRVGRVRPVERADDLPIAVDVEGAAEVALDHREPAVPRVDMGVLEARQHQPVPEGDHLGRSTDHVADGVRTERYDPPFADRDGVGPRQSRIDGVDLCVCEDEVGRTSSEGARVHANVPRSGLDHTANVRSRIGAGGVDQHRGCSLPRGATL